MGRRGDLSRQASVRGLGSVLAKACLADSAQFSVFSLGAVWSPRRPIYAVLRYQLIARATYLPKGYLTKPRLRLRCDSQTRFGNKAQIYSG